MTAALIILAILLVLAIVAVVYFAMKARQAETERPSGLASLVRTLGPLLLAL